MGQHAASKPDVILPPSLPALPLKQPDGRGAGSTDAGEFTPTPFLADIIDLVQEQAEQWPWLFAEDGADGPAEEEEDDGAEQASLQAEAERREAAAMKRRIERESGRLLKAFRQKQRKPAYQKMQAQRKRLPAYQMEDTILSTIRGSQVVVISGETGCGKTTQLPQLVLDDMLRNGEGAMVNMICTQPRRISAIGVADRCVEQGSHDLAFHRCCCAVATGTVAWQNQGCRTLSSSCVFDGLVCSVWQASERRRLERLSVRSWVPVVWRELLWLPAAGKART